MAKTDLMQKGELTFARQMLMFKENIGPHAAALGLTPAQVAAQAADADYYQHVVMNHNLVLGHSKSWTVLKKSLRRGKPDAGVDSLPVLDLPAPPPAVPSGVEGRFRRLVRLVKLSANYTPTIGAELGIEAASLIAPNPAALQPQLTAQVNGSHVELGWDWQGYRAFLDQCECQVNRNDGLGFVPLKHSVVPGCWDETPFPAGPAVWQYRAIYHADGQRIGQWSQTASVTVEA